MKEIMALESSSTVQGVPSFEYNPKYEHQTPLFELSKPLDDLEQMLLSEFSGLTLTVEKLYEMHCRSASRNYVMKNYADHVSISFP